MVKTKEEFLVSLKNRIGEDTSDDALALIEDFTDTYDDLSNRMDEDWKKKYEDLDASWRERYKARFFDGNANTQTVVIDKAAEDVIEDDPEEKETFEDLFVEEVK